MRKPCTDCPHNKKTHIKRHDGSRGSTWHSCYLLGYYMGYHEMIANCVDYAEYLAWQRVNRKEKQNK